MKYPLEQLVEIKKRRFEKAVLLLEEKKRILDQEEKLLRKKEEERNSVLQHKKDKLKQMDDAFNEGTTSDKIQQMKKYLETIEETLSKKEAAVKQQKKKADEANVEVEAAKKKLFIAEKDLEKLKIHKDLWNKDVALWLKKQEAKILDEIGGMRHYRKKE